jgi:hypothetical protein
VSCEWEVHHWTKNPIKGILCSRFDGLLLHVSGPLREPLNVPFFHSYRGTLKISE